MSDIKVGDKARVVNFPHWEGSLVEVVKGASEDVENEYQCVLLEGKVLGYGSGQECWFAASCLEVEEPAKPVETWRRFLNDDHRDPDWV